MNRIIYSYWIGDEKRKNELLKYYEKVNAIIFPWKIKLGPSKEEHLFLLKNSSFYKKSFELGIFSFCSDIWRLYVIYQNGGCYIDSGCTYNFNHIKNFLHELEGKDYAFVLETPAYFWSGFFYFKEKNNDILLNIMNYMNKLSKKNFKHIVIITRIMSNFLFKNFGYLIEKNENIKIIKSCDFSPNNDQIIKMHNTASWFEKVGIKKDIEIQEIWNSIYKSFDVPYEKKSKLFIRRFLASNLIHNTLLTYKWYKKSIYFFAKIISCLL